jgi:hypothetical protein
MVNKGRELLKAISERGAIEFFDSAANPADAAADENLPAARRGKLIFAAAESLMVTGSGEFCFAESFQKASHRGATAQTSTSNGHTESNRTNSNPANFNQQNLMAFDERESDADGRIRVLAPPRKLYSAETDGIRVRKIRREVGRRIDESGKKKRGSFGNFSTAARVATRTAATV